MIIIKLTIGLIVFAVSFIILFVLIIPSIYCRYRSPTINKNNLNKIGREIARKLAINGKILHFCISGKVKRSHVKVIEKSKEYIVYVKDTKWSRKVSTIIHELIHIKKGHSDNFNDFDIPVVNEIINCYLDVLFCYPVEINHFKWSRNSFN